MIDTARLRDFEPEHFYSVLEVALEIKVDLGFGVTEIYLPAQQKLVRHHRVLLPAATPSLLHRYCELRLKALLFLQRQGYLAGVEDQRTGWDDLNGGSFCVTVADENAFLNLAQALRDEEERRELGGSRAQLESDAMSRIEAVCNGFNRSARRLKLRHGNRKGFQIDDEYDVQDLLWALLEAQFSDIRDEEPTPSHAGKSARADFLLRAEQIVVETKMMRDGLSDGKLADELLLDIARYRAHPHCKAIFCFVYDPDGRLDNPAALERDLSRDAEGLPVRVRIRPAR
jgi:REase_DpnII-MboI